MSSASILELKALAAQHVDKFNREGRGAQKGSSRVKSLQKSKDPFDKQSPGLIKRLANEARNDAKRRHFQDDEAGPSDEQRRAIMKAKAKKYDAIRRGDFSKLSKKDLDEGVIDFERKYEEDNWSDHSSDEDESARPAKRPHRARSSSGSSTSASDAESDDLYDIAVVEYVDELGRTRMGTRKEARAAERAAQKAKRRRAESPEPGPVQDNSAYAEVLKSNVIHGDQNFFPVYEPDPDALRKKYKEAEEEARAHHYDATKEVRTRAAGQYQFSLDEEKRSEQMASMNALRDETERARAEAAKRNGRTLAQEAWHQRRAERWKLVEAEQELVLGKEAVEELRRERQAKEAEEFLARLERQLPGGGRQEDVKPDLGDHNVA